MKKITSLFTLLALTVAPLSAELTDLATREKMMDGLDVIKDTLEVVYAPAEWKKTYADWDLGEQIESAKAEVLETPSVTIKDYQVILRRFFNSMRDYHVGVHFYSTEFAILPFRVHSAEGKYYLAWVYDSIFAGLKDPIKKGDEVLLFDGRPVHDVVQELKLLELGNPESATDQALAEEMLTMRSGRSGNLVPSGPVNITVRHAGSKQVHTYRLNWFYNPEEVTGTLSPVTVAKKTELISSDYNGMQFFFGKREKRAPLGESPFFYKDMSTPIFKYRQEELAKRGKLLQEAVVKELALEDVNAEDDRFIGSKKSFVPTLGQVVWKCSPYAPFDAYIYKNSDGKRIGYLRIPHFGAGAQTAKQLAKIINQFELETDALVLDQLHNPGGSLFYMYAVAGMLTHYPLVVPTEQVAITQQDAYFAIFEKEELEGIESDEEARDLIGETVGGYPVDLTFAQQVAEYCNSILSEWDAGRQITQPLYFYGVNEIQPHVKGFYSKPILMLVNELDFSCGDFLPAILQDNGRATILGTRTAGAGGAVLQHSFPNVFGVQGFSYTGTLAHRVDSNPIENLGVTPDRWVSLTVNDMENNYADYVSEIHKAVKELLNQ